MHRGRFTSTPHSLPIHALLGLSLIVVVFMLTITATPLAQTEETAIIVDTVDDELDDGGDDSSLREAIQAANTDSPVDGCPAGDGDDAIVLPAGSYVLTLAGTDEDANATGDLNIITGTVILMGPGPERTVIDGNQLDRVLHVHSGATVEIHGIRITSGRTPGGYPGGGTQCRGGIHNAETLLLYYSTVISNTTGSGEVPLVDGDHGGGIYNSQTLALRNSTISYNTAGSVEGDGLGGGIYTQGVLTGRNTILAGNRDTSGSRDCYQEGALLLSLGCYLVESVGTCVLNGTGDLTGTDPLLGPLGDYGGDTFTHALLPGSLAIDQGSCRDSLTDQRCFLRPIDCAPIPNADDGCDIGAFEYYPFLRIYLPLAVRHSWRYAEVQGPCQRPLVIGDTGSHHRHDRPPLLGRTAAFCRQ